MHLYRILGRKSIRPIIYQLSLYYTPLYPITRGDKNSTPPRTNFLLLSWFSRKRGESVNAERRVYMGSKATTTYNHIFVVCALLKHGLDKIVSKKK